MTTCVFDEGFHGFTGRYWRGAAEEGQEHMSFGIPIYGHLTVWYTHIWSYDAADCMHAPSRRDSMRASMASPRKFTSREKAAICSQGY